MLRCALLLSMASVAVWAAPAASSPALDELISAARRIEPGQDRTAFRGLEEQVRAAVDDPGLRVRLEIGLLKLLEPDASYDAKSFACKHLAFVGSDKAVPAIAALLPDAQMAPVASAALGAMKSEKALNALREALKQSSGKTRVQIVNTLGDRRDSKSIGPFSVLLKADDFETAACAAAALGKIGTKRAGEVLAKAVKTAPDRLRIALDEARLDCASTLAASGNARVARAIYEELLDASKPPFLRRAAFGGLIHAAPDHGQALAIKALRGNDAVLKPVGIEAVRRIPGQEAARAFVRILPDLPIEDQAAMIDSIAGRPEKEARACVVNALTASEAALRIAAANALGRVGGAGDVPALARALAASKSSDELRALESALTALHGGAATDAAVVTALKSAPPSARPSLLRIVSARTGPAANPLLVQQLTGDDLLTTRAALRALSRTAGPDEAPALLRNLRLAKSDVDRSEARAACERALAQVQDPNVRFAVLQSELKASAGNPESTAALIALLPACATPASMEALSTYLESTQAGVREAAFEALVEWPGMDAWGPLLSSFRNSAAVSERQAALRALVRLAGEANSKPDEALLGKYRQLFDGANSEADYKLILGALGGVAHPAALEMALGCLDQAGVRAEAEAAVRKIAESIKASHPDAASAAMQKIQKNQ